jgi:hypothetical protein
MLGIRDSKVFLACVDSVYQDLDRSMSELEEARALNSISQGKTVITLVVEENPFLWASARLRDLCGFSSSLFVDISGSARLDWESENGATPSALAQLRRHMGPLIRLLDENGCKPVYASKMLTAPDVSRVSMAATTTMTTSAAQNALLFDV